MYETPAFAGVAEKAGILLFKIHNFNFFFNALLILK